MILPLAIPYWATGLLVGGFLIVCVILMLVVLIQRPQGGGLSGAFGAGGSSGGAGQTAFGTKTGDALTFATIGMFILYLAFAVGLNFATRPENIDHETVPTVTSTNPVETTDSGPLIPEGTATETAPAGDEGAGDAVGLEGGVDDAVDTTEQAAEQIINDAQNAASPATEPGTTEPGTAEPAPTDPPATDPATGETPPGL